MKKRMLLLALTLVTGTAAYGMENTDKQSCNNAPETTSITSENINVNASEELLTLLATDNKQSDVMKWIGQHKKLIATVAGLSAVYCARNVPFLSDLDTETGTVAHGSRNQALPKIGLNRFLRIKWACASNKEKVAATLLAITTTLLIYDLAQGKDAKLVKLWNKILNSIKSSTKNSQQPEKAPVIA